MYLSSISLKNYKNHAQQVFQLHPKINLIVGLNGVGKTNLLDAIYYSGIGKSYFSSSDRHIIMKGEGFMRIESLYIDDNGDKNKVTIVSANDKKKAISLDGKKYKRISDHIGKYPCVMISPTDVQELLDTSEARRRFLDQSIVQYDRTYLRHLQEYNRLLKQRNSLLKQFAESKSWNDILLLSITEKMMMPAEYIHNSRKDFVGSITPLFSETYSIISEERECAAIRYESSLAELPLLQSMKNSLEKDKILQRTTQGIHKDNIRFLMNDDDLKIYASQGQLKSFVMALKLSQYQIIQNAHNNSPILLLDDIFDKLDQSRVKHILDILIHQDYGQVFISDTNLYRVENILQILETNYHKFVIDNAESINLEIH